MKNKNITTPMTSGCTKSIERKCLEDTEEFL